MMFRVFLRLLVIILPLYHEYVAGEAPPTIRHRRTTLVLVDDYFVRDTHSQFFRSLRTRGHKLTFKLAGDSNVTFFRYNERRYDNVILFAPAAQPVDGALDESSLLRFVDDGGSLLVAVDEQPSVMVRELAAECGVELNIVASPRVSSFVVDHFRHVVGDATHTTLAVDARNLIRAPPIVGPADAYTAPILYRGVELLVDDQKPEVLSVLTADGTAIVNRTDRPQAADKATLVAAAQMMNNSRVVVSGSLELFSDAFAAQEFAVADGDSRYEKSANALLTDRVSRWVFQETGVLRVKAVSHHREGEQETPFDYTVNEMAVYEIELVEKVDDEWRPFDAQDLFVEFTMLHPYLRTRMTSLGGGRHRCTFRVPDKYGVFKFVVDYKRVGRSFVWLQTMVSVRPLKHYQFERFLLVAYPYYVGAFSMMIVTFVFSCVYLHGDYENKTKSE